MGMRTTFKKLFPTEMGLIRTMEIIPVVGIRKQIKGAWASFFRDKAQKQSDEPLLAHQYVHMMPVLLGSIISLATRLSVIIMLLSI